MYFFLIGVQLFKKAQRKRIPQVRVRVIKIMVLINDRAIFALWMAVRAHIFAVPMQTSLLCT